MICKKIDCKKEALKNEFFCDEHYVKKEWTARPLIPQPEITTKDLKKVWSFVVFTWKRINDELRFFIIHGFIGIVLTYIYFHMGYSENIPPAHNFAAAAFLAMISMCVFWPCYGIFCFLRNSLKAFKNERNQ